MKNISALRALEILVHAICAFGLAIALSTTFLHADLKEKHVSDLYDVWTILSVFWFGFCFVKPKKPLTTD